MTQKNNQSLTATDQLQQFLSELRTCLGENKFVKLILSKYVGTEPELNRVLLKQITLRNEDCLSFVYRYKTKDITKNFPIAIAIDTIRELLNEHFKNAHLSTLTEEVQLSFEKNGDAFIRRSKAAPQEAPSKEHDRDKKRYVDLQRPFLTELGVTNGQRQLIHSMSAKWKQINKFIEVFSHAFATSSLAAEQRALQIADFGSGKGYLTFAIHDYLSSSLKRDTQVMGIELRKDLVTLCNGVVTRLGQTGLRFQEGDIRSYTPSSIDVMIALHACDVATDYAIHLGIRSGASIIMCSPCCHKQIRQQIQSPLLLKPILQHGVHMGEEAEMLTDSMRALLLEAAGYETKVFEFISLEHTNKNKMILAIKHNRPVNRAELLGELANIKEFYGIREQCLETLLNADDVKAA